jgi:hypothetical protein
VHPFWEDIRLLPHLKKVSISRWCNEKFMGEALRGTGIVYSRKPDPRFLGIDVKLDEGLDVRGFLVSAEDALDRKRRPLGSARARQPRRPPHPPFLPREDNSGSRSSR